MKDFEVKFSYGANCRGLGFEGFLDSLVIEILVLKVKNTEISPYFIMSAIDGLKWLASRFRPNLLSERADRQYQSLSRKYPRTTPTGPQEHPDQSEVTNRRG